VVMLFQISPLLCQVMLGYFRLGRVREVWPVQVRLGQFRAG